MPTNSTIEAMLRRKTIRSYTERSPTDDVVSTIVRAGQQAPFASQLYSLLLSRKLDRNPFDAPLLFTICIDLHKLELLMARRNWRVVTNDLLLLLFGAQDASLMAENMVMAAESLGLGSCFLGAAPYRADIIAQEYKLPPRVFPLVQMTMGYPAEDPPPRPRYPMDFVLFEDEYPEVSEDTISAAMREMDEGYLAQDYYLGGAAMISLEGDREETYSSDTYSSDTYSWTEHISRKWGQWFPSVEELLDQLSGRGFSLYAPAAPPREGQER
jgi:nitroreductase